MRQNQSKEPEPSSQTPSYRDLFQKVQLLIQIRWFSAIGILLIVLQEAILKHAVPSVIGKTLVIFFLVVALNTFYVLSVVRSFKRRPHLSTHYLWGFLLGQLIVDIFLMAAAIHFSGGIDSDYKFLMILTPLVAALVIPPFAVTLVATCSITAYFTVLYLEATGILHHHVVAQHGSFERYKSLSHVIADFGILLGLIAVSCLIVGYLNLSLQKSKRILRVSRKELMLLKDRYRQLIEQAKDAIFLVDENATIRLSNRSGKELLGLTDGKSKAIPLTEILRPQDREPFLTQIRSILSGLRQSNTAETFEGRTEKKEGHGPLILLFSVAPVSSEDGKTDILCIVRDITEQRQMESQQILSEKMSAMGILAGGMSHEFNNLLASIRGYAQLAQQRMTNESLIRTALQVIEEQTTRGKEFIERLNRFSFPEAPCNEIVDLGEVLEEVFQFIKNQLRKEHINVVKHIPSSTLVFGDRGQLHQVFLNLAINARHAIIPKGKGVITVKIQNTQKEILVEFSDTGIGMSPEKVFHAFEPFFTTKGSLGSGPTYEEQVSPPTGLGLSLVHAILEAHGGSVRVESTPDAGSTFSVVLPRVSQEKEHGDPLSLAPHPPVLANRQILIAVEDPPLRQLLEELVRSRGGDAQGVDRGGAVLDTLDRRACDFLFLESSLSGIHLEELLHEVRRSYPYLRVVLFVDSAFPEEKTHRLQQAGVVAILRKPLHLPDIDEILSSLCSATQDQSP